MPMLVIFSILFIYMNSAVDIVLFELEANKEHNNKAENEIVM